MKKQLLLCLCLLLTTLLPAQITVTNATFPALGDTLHLATDHSPGAINALTPPGGNQFWDFSSLQADLTFEIIYKAASEGSVSASLPSADLLTISGSTETYYNVTANEFEQLAMQGPDPFGFNIPTLMNFSPRSLSDGHP